MAKQRLLPTVNVDGYFTAKVKGAIKDVDVGKPVRLSTDVPDTYQLSADGEAIDAFIETVDASTSDSLSLCTLNNMGRVRCEADGALTIGGFVEAAANAAAGTANTNGLPLIAAKTAVIADIAIDASGTVIAGAVNAILADMVLPLTGWRVVSGITEDGDVADEDTYVVIERV